MIRLTNLNQISKQLEEEIPEFGPGDIKTFQYLNGTRVEDAETGKIEIAYGKFSIRCKDTIFDPYLRGGKGDTVSIGIPVSFEGERVTEFQLFFPCANVVKFNGKFDLNGDVPEDVDVFKFLWISNFLKNNPHRNKKQTPMFELLPGGDKPLVKQVKGEDGEVVVTALSNTKEAKKLKKELESELV